jgi:hypothetical protein
MRVVFGRIDGRKLALTEDVTINPSCDVRKLCNPRSVSSISMSDDERVKSLASPWNLRKQVPSNPFWKFLVNRLLQTRSHDSTAVDVTMEELGNKGRELAAVTARLNWLIGWRVGGHLSRSSSTNSGITARAAQSLDNSVTCSEVGTSPVSKSQKRPSGSGSLPPGAFGRSC